MLKFLLVVCFSIRLSTIYAKPTQVNCENKNNLNYRQLCWFRSNLANQEREFEDDYQDAQMKRNSEISTALYSLYGDGSPGKRNPELSSALMNYIENLRKYSNRS